MKKIWVGILALLMLPFAFLFPKSKRNRRTKRCKS